MQMRPRGDREPAQDARRPGRAGRSRPGGPDRGGQVWRHVPGAGPAHPWPARPRCRRPQDVERAREALRRVGWSDERFAAASFADALSSGGTLITDDVEQLVAAPGLEVVIKATGNPAAGVRHCLVAIDQGRHIVMVTVEADALAGPLLASWAERAGLIYSLVWGD